MAQSLQIEFEGVGTATAGELAKSLREFLLDDVGSKAEIQVAIERKNPETMNLGDTLLVEVIEGVTVGAGHVVGSFAMELVIKTIHKWREVHAKPGMLVINRENGQVSRVSHNSTEFSVAGPEASAVPIAE